jgi:hypothetical protein
MTHTLGDKSLKAFGVRLVFCGDFICLRVAGVGGRGAGGYCRAYADSSMLKENVASNKTSGQDMSECHALSMVQYSPANEVHLQAISQDIPGTFSPARTSAIAVGRDGMKGASEARATNMIRPMTLSRSLWIASAL